MAHFDTMNPDERPRIGGAGGVASRHEDYVCLALSMSREEFASRYPFLFLYTRAHLSAPEGATPTRSGPDTRLLAELVRPRSDTPKRADTPPLDPPVGPLLLSPIRKVQPTFPSIISLGRLLGSDVVVPDESVSKLHAYFQRSGDTLLLVDAGSTNGTWVDERRLEPNREGRQVRPRSTVRLGPIALTVLDAATCWAHANASRTR